MGQPNSKSSQKQVMAKTNNSHINETKSNTDLIVVRNRFQQHADNMNFLLNIVCMPQVLTVLIFEYVSFDFRNIVRHGLTYFAGNTGTIPSLGFFKVNEDKFRELADAEIQAKVLADNHILPAGPLDKLETEAKKNPDALLHPIRTKMTLDGIDFILEGSPLQLPIILLDQTMQSPEDSTVPMTDQGQAEMEMELIQQLRSERIFEAEEQVRFAACFDPATNKAERSKVLNDAFEKIKENNFDAAGKIIRDYIINTKHDVITDNQYFSNLLQLIPEALNLLITRANELKDGLYGDQADQFCFKTLGMIERVLPFKLRKILETGLYYSLYQGRNIDRALDVSDVSYQVKGTGRLGDNRFFDDIGDACRRWARRSCCAAAFSELLSAITTAQQNLCSDRTLNRRTMP